MNPTAPDPTAAELAAAEPTVVIVPGLRDHVAGHWQTLLAARLTEAGRTVRTLSPVQENRLSLDAQVANLAETLASVDGPVLLVAHSAGVLTTVHWAARHTADVRGALLATPPDFDTPLPEGYPTQDELDAHAWTPVPTRRLPFPSIVVASANDPLATLDAVADLARRWGSALLDVGEVGHLNPASGYGPWPLAEEILCTLDSPRTLLPAVPTGRRG
ncbi:alpha/beta hydrolase [Streptomyces sp. NPDC048623]|uniref:RBBP9/YdeN family alpha/beta hydrolase n=1 Tax=Streptomyces sp. NPDC048623 TaxID=3155761 RepID=UPI003441AABD